MGGYGSNRWNWHSTKPGSDPLSFIDVRYLARHGFFAAPPNQWRTFTITWSRRGEPTGSMEIHVVGVEGGQPPDVELDYRFRRFDSEPWTPVRERVKLDYTPCNYGGARPWFLCPGCLKRKAVLRSVHGRFRCNACNGVAYTSTREDWHDRMCRKAQDARRKLGAGPGPIWDRPPKPKGMHWKTYLRICEPIERSDEILSLAVEDMERRFARLRGRS